MFTEPNSLLFLNILPEIGKKLVLKFEKIILNITINI